RLASILSVVDEAELAPDRLIVRPRRAAVEALVGAPIAERREVFTGATSVGARTGDVKRTGALRLDEACRGDVSLDGATLSTARNGNFVRSTLALDEAFWRVVGLYLAEGCATAHGNRRELVWSFHPTREEHLVDEVVAYWSRH